MSSPKTIEYVYAAHSAFAYLGSARLASIAHKADCVIVHKPFDLRRVLAQNGAQPFAQRSRAHLDCFFRRELDRWSEERNAPIMGHLPTYHRNDITLPNCPIIAALMAGLNVDRLEFNVASGSPRL